MDLMGSSWLAVGLIAFLFIQAIIYMDLKGELRALRQQDSE